MCHECSLFLNSNDPETVMAEVRKYSEIMEKQTSGLLAFLNRYEDKYRNVGLVYHSTQSRTREPRDDTRESLERLKAAFEISRIEEYHAIVAPHNDMMQRLLKFRKDVQHAACRGTVAERYHCCLQELVPVFDDFDAEANKLKEDFGILVEDAALLDSISRVYHETNVSGHRIAWQDPVHEADGGRFVPARMQEEWNTFRAWVWSLPETQRAVTAGYRSLDEVALELLFSEDEAVMHT